MDPKDSQPQPVPQNEPQTPAPLPSTPGIGMAEPVFQAPPTATQDTIVIPPTDAAPKTETPQPANPFIPQVGVPGGEAPKAKSPILKILLIIGVLVLLSAGIFFVLQSMGGGSGGGAATKEVTIQYWGLWENDAVTRQFIADFETTHPGIKVQYTQQSPKQYRERLQSAINRDEGPDVFRFHNTWIPMLRTQLMTVPETVMTPAEFSTTFFPVVTNDLVAGSSIFGIPLMIDGLGLYINEELFATAGAAEPTTWTDVINLIPKLTVKNGTAIVTGAIALGTTNNVEHFSDIIAVMFLQNGANLTNPTGTEAEGTMIFYRKFADASDPLYTWSDGLDNSVSAFANSRVAMILAPSWRAHEISQLNPKLRFHISPIPQLQGNSVAWSSYWVEGVSLQSKNKAAAWEFVKYATSSEAASKFFTEASRSRLFGEPYARVDLANTVTNDPYVGAYVKQALYARSFPLASRTYDNGLNDKLIQYLTDAVNGMIRGGGSPTQVLATMSQGFRQVLTSYGLSTGADVTPTP